jgi:hypothetical protein
MPTSTPSTVAPAPATSSVRPGRLNSAAACHWFSSITAKATPTVTVLAIPYTRGGNCGGKPGSVPPDTRYAPVMTRSVNPIGATTPLSYHELSVSRGFTVRSSRVRDATIVLVRPLLIGRTVPEPRRPTREREQRPLPRACIRERPTSHDCATLAVTNEARPTGALSSFSDSVYPKRFNGTPPDWPGETLSAVSPADTPVKTWDKHYEYCMLTTAVLLLGVSVAEGPLCLFARVECLLDSLPDVLSVGWMVLLQALLEVGIRPFGKM